MDKEKFDMEKIVGSALELSAFFFLIGQVLILKYGVKSLFLLFKLRKKKKNEVSFPL